MQHQNSRKSPGTILQFAIRYSLFAMFIFLLSGCSSLSLPSLPWSTPTVQPNATVEALFDEGITFFNNKRYPLAIDRFQRVKAEFPFSPQLVPTELKLAEAYYLNKQYPEAAAAFKEFQTLHPNNENIPFVLYHMGLVYFDQFTSSDRYQKVTEIAKGYFESVVKDHPGSPYAAPAKEKLAKCIEYLSEHEFNIAVFYFNEKKYPAAIDRLEGILRRYRDTPFAVKALYYLGESYRLEKNTVKAGLAYEALIHHYPEDPLAKTAQARVSELAQEKQDPLAMLLKQDGRTAFAVAQKPESGAIQNPKSKIENPKDLNLVAKKEVVHEEPGEEKGILRRVGSALNPLGWFSSDDKKENQKEKIAVANKKEQPSGSSGSFWSSLNPFASKADAKVEARPDPQLVSNVDEALKQKGIDSGTENVLPKAPASDLPKVEEPAPPPSNTAELLGNVDTALQKKGKSLSDLPPPPEPAAIFKASSAAPGKPVTPTAVTSSTPTSKELISGIDEALRRKGIEPAKVETTTKTDDRRPTTESPGLPSAVSSRPKVELAPKLPQEKGPLFLDTGMSPAQEKAKEGQTSDPAVAQPAKSTEPGKELPQAVIKGPPTAKEKPAETKVTEKKKSPDDEEEKSAFEQLREDLGRVRDALNPFSW